MTKIQKSLELFLRRHTRMWRESQEPTSDALRQQLKWTCIPSKHLDNSLQSMTPFNNPTDLWLLLLLLLLLW